MTRVVHLGFGRRDFCFIISTDEESTKTPLCKQMSHDKNIARECKRMPQPTFLSQTTLNTLFFDSFPRDFFVDLNSIRFY